MFAAETTGRSAEGVGTGTLTHRFPHDLHLTPFVGRLTAVFLSFFFFQVCRLASQKSWRPALTPQEVRTESSAVSPSPASARCRSAALGEVLEGAVPLSPLETVEKVPLMLSSAGSPHSTAALLFGGTSGDSGSLLRLVLTSFGSFAPGLRSCSS